MKSRFSHVVGFGDAPFARSHRGDVLKVPGGARKWRLIQQAGPMEPLAGVYVQLVGIKKADTEALIQRLALNSVLPEPLRTAHLIAGGIIIGESRHRP